MTRDGAVANRAILRLRTEAAKSWQIDRWLVSASDALTWASTRSDEELLLIPGFGERSLEWVRAQPGGAFAPVEGWARNATRDDVVQMTTALADIARDLASIRIGLSNVEGSVRSIRRKMGTRP